MRLSVGITLAFPVGTVKGFIPVYHATAPAAFLQRYDVSAANKRATSTELNEVIRGIEEAELVDEGLGGVRLAMESAVKIVGSKKKGALEATDMIRYIKLSDFEMSGLQGVMDDCGNSVVCTGYGKETYHDPGKSVEKRIDLAPIEAAKDALSSAPNSSVSSASRLSVNFLGGDDLMLHEVMQAAEMVVDGLDLSPKCKVSFNSLCHSSFPLEYASLTVIAVGDEKSEGGEALSQVEKSVAKGDVYFYQGKWWTVSEEDINTAKD